MGYNQDSDTLKDTLWTQTAHSIYTEDAEGGLPN